MFLKRKAAIQMTRDMWNWIADETEKRQRIVLKIEYFIENKIPSVFCDCFLCEYALEEKGMRCVDKCPLNFGGTMKYACEYVLDSPYRDWKTEAYVLVPGNWKRAAKYARRIANLPEREV